MDTILKEEIQLANNPYDYLVQHSLLPLCSLPQDPVSIDWFTLAFLHQLILNRRVMTVLEFGVGNSTKIMAAALLKNKKKYASFVSNNFKKNNAFELHSVDALPEYISLTKNSTPQELLSLIHFHHHKVIMGEFNNRICTYYDALPNLCPDFIYLDGPDQFSVSGDIRNITTAHPERLPMAADLLAIEHFLLPGTLIVIDGRTANARFLKTNFQRGWHYQYFESPDIHLFELREMPLGKYNREKIIFSLGENWIKAHE